MKMKMKWVQVALLAGLVSGANAKAPNVLFFSLDDMNDWVGAMGYAQAVTPNMDRLAKNGVNFLNAHAAGVFCAPSRSAIFTGRHASTTGCYTTQVYFHNHPEINPLHKVLHDGGYATYGAGKLFHHPAGFIDQRGWTEYFFRTDAQRKAGWNINTWNVDDPILPDPYPNSVYNQDREPANKFFMEWGKIKNEDEEKMADTLRTEWACALLRQKHDQPIFVGVGLYATHFPNYAPEKYFDLYDPGKIELPPYRADDLDDLPPAVKKAKTGRSEIHKRLEALDAVDDAIHGYLACISYQDAMLGRLLEAIESGPNAGNTIVVLWSDQGYHHGEKFDWGKHTLWERTSNVPFIWAGPGIFKGADVEATVSLMDMFPTLTELCGIKDGQARDGTSLAPILADPSTAKDREVLLPGMKPEEYAIINRNWRYIRYADGTEELYNTRQDPNEWNNLANNPEFKELKTQLAASAPQAFAEPGMIGDELKLVTEGDSFKWVGKRKAAPKKLSDTVQGSPMVPRENSDEAEMTPDKVNGKEVWISKIRDGAPTYFYFKLRNRKYANAKQPRVQIQITYLDQGNTRGFVQYDSSDASANAGGTFKQATTFKVGNSGQWKTLLFNLDDAQFSGRSNGGDLRIAFDRPDADPVVAEVLVKPLN
ncbi:Choline-sulfatase [Pontiella desulfatans]|uniref:Choline-sulfatase n=1 Tax=Pontiella desulfatans TaxID=2750659 RepID=A0A6C2TYV1_PONDE|nr:sulfatase [Pontiella desulfatans]SPS73698.1 sulfatase S1_7 [Kiritimatiellales bacterium]VGO12797.1 Choline-sulfatase [Pontiella desulfatans]